MSDENEWWHKGTRDIQEFADAGDVKSYYGALKKGLWPIARPTNLTVQQIWDSNLKKP